MVKVANLLGYLKVSAYRIPLALLAVVLTGIVSATQQFAHAAAPACNTTSLYCSVDPVAAGINAFSKLSSIWGAILSSTGGQVVTVLAVVVGIGWVMRTFRRSGGR